MHVFKAFVLLRKEQINKQNKVYPKHMYVADASFVNKVLEWCCLLAFKVWDQLHVCFLLSLQRETIFVCLRLLSMMMKPFKRDIHMKGR